MKARFRKYKPEDFLPIRDFLVTNYKAFPHPVNWDLIRWNYARFFCAPMIGAWGLGKEAQKVPDTSGEASKEAIRFWEGSIGIWETDSEKNSEEGSEEGGEIVGVVCPDEYVLWHPAFGQAFLQRHPDHEYLLPKMLEYAERTFVGKCMTRIYVGEHDETLQNAAKHRGFVQDEKPCMHYTEFDLGNVPESSLPDGYWFVTMAENNDIEKRREVLGLSFRHPDPNDWATAYSYKELQKAPDYHKERDIVIQRPDGKWVACTIAWLDEANKIGTLEPVGAIQLGMGREVVLEGLRRLKNLGAKVAYVDSGLKFYEVIGFEKKFGVYRWVKQHSTI